MLGGHLHPVLMPAHADKRVGLESRITRWICQIVVVAYRIYLLISSLVQGEHFSRQWPHCFIQHGPTLLAALSCSRDVDEGCIP